MKGKKTATKVYIMEVQLKLNEKPEGRRYGKGKILKIKRIKDHWLVNVEYKASSMIELMVLCDNRVITTELQ
jgi:hypothetical protein